MRVTDITPINERSNKPIRLAAYCRVSSSSEDQLHSFAAQIRYYNDYKRRHPEYELVDIYADMYNQRLIQLDSMQALKNAIK